MPKTHELIYAAVGAGDFTIQKVRDLSLIPDRQKTGEIYDDFVKRGRQISKRIQNSAATKNAVAQTKTARAQVKAAATSVRKAVKADVKATQTAASKTIKS